MMRTLWEHMHARFFPCAAFFSITIAVQGLCYGNFIVDQIDLAATGAGNANSSTVPYGYAINSSPGVTQVGSAGGVAFQYSANRNIAGLDNQHYANATAGGVSSAITPFDVGTNVGSLQAIATAGATGSGGETATPLVGPPDTSGDSNASPFELSGFGFTAGHGGQARVDGAVANGAPFPQVLVGMLYTGVAGGCETTVTSHASASCSTFLVDAFASVEGHTSTSELSMGAGVDFQLFSVQIPNGVPDVNLIAQANATITGSGGVATDQGPLNASALAVGNAVSVASAYAWLAPAGVAPVLGDNNFDNQLDANDIDNLAAQARTLALNPGGATNPNSVFEGAEPLFDVNLDTSVTYGVGGII